MSTTNWNHIDNLVKKSLHGDKDAYREFLGLISSYIDIKLNKVLPSSFRDDTRQEVLMAIHKSLKTLDTSKSCRAWVNAITHYKVSDALRKIYKEDCLEKFEDYADIEVDKVQLKQYIENIKKSLSSKEAHVLMKLKYEGHSVSEVATDLGLTESNVKVISFRALKKAREFIAKEEFDER